MKRTPEGDNCLRCSLTRRRFLSVGCAGALGLAAAKGGADQTGQALGVNRKPRIRIIYSLHSPVQKVPDWPNVDFDFRPVMDRYNSALTAGCPAYDLVSTMASGPEDARKIIDNDRNQPVAGYIVFQLNCWNKVIQTIAGEGKPVLYVDFQYGGSGGFLVYNAAFLREGTANVAFAASSRLPDVVAAARCFDVYGRTGSTADFVAAVSRARAERLPGSAAGALINDRLETLAPEETVRVMKGSRILAIGGNWPGTAPAIKEGMGIEVVDVPFSELDEAWKAADKEESRAIADRWKRTARKVVGVSFDTLAASAAMYLAEKAVLAKHGARAITINCLGGFYGGHIHAYPCLGFHELLNQGFIGACECDVRSTATMVAVSAMTKGRPGYISDPVIDCGSRRIIYAHCVAHNRPFGPKGPVNQFEILTHSEDHQGAAVRSLLPVGYMTSTFEFSPERKLILFHRGRAVDNVIDDRACRTKLAVEPDGDIEKLFREWDKWGWHRVTYYGDLKDEIQALAGTMGWKVLEET